RTQNQNLERRTKNPERDLHTRHYEVPTCVRKFSMTVRTNGVGIPFRISGEYFHCFTASMAALSRNFTDRSTFTDSTDPSAPTTASRITIPLTFAMSATSGYAGSTRFTSAGALTFPPIRMGAVCLGSGGAGGGGGGGGGAAINPPTMPPGTPPSRPPST